MRKLLLALLVSAALAVGAPVSAEQARPTDKPSAEAPAVPNVLAVVRTRADEARAKLRAAKDEAIRKHRATGAPLAPIEVRLKPVATEAFHDDGAIAGSRPWKRASTGTTFFMNYYVSIVHDNIVRKWFPFHESSCDAYKSNGTHVDVKCNHKQERFQSNLYGSNGDTSPEVLNEAGPFSAICRTDSDVSGWERDVGTGWYMARMYIWQVRFLDDNCGSIYLTNRYSTGSYVVQVGYPVGPHPRYSDPNRTGMHLLG